MILATVQQFPKEKYQHQYNEEFLSKTGKENLRVNSYLVYLVVVCGFLIVFLKKLFWDQDVRDKHRNSLYFDHRVQQPLQQLPSPK